MASKPKTVPRASSRTKASTPLPTVTRTTRTINTRATPTPPLHEPAVKKAPTRKPFVDRNASPEGKGRIGVETNKPNGKSAIKATRDTDTFDEMYTEPIRAFLRLRPQLGDEDDSPSHSNPYLEQISSTAVRMSDHLSPRLSTPQSSVYTFSHVFPPKTSQSDFFAQTTLPLVKDVLEGQSGLLFAYGVTNSGKTYTMQGGGEEGSAGILPRTLDVIFNSIEGLHGDGRFRPVRLQGVEASLPSLSASRLSQSSAIADDTQTALADVLFDLPPSDPDTDPTTFKLDRNHEYTIWLSYAEIYNDKVYDLFASVDTAEGYPTSHSRPPSMSRPTSTFLNLPVPSSQSNPLLLTRKALPVKPCPPSDTDDDNGSSGKYVSGLRQLRVTSGAQAKALLRLGQMHRQVFGTLANSQSSRSHAIVTIKVLRVHKGERNDPTSIQTSRLTLVDLAGSERTRNTQTTGERLREAGNINKSLMVLGQCMETMRANQRTIARSLNTAVSESDRLDTRDVKKGLAIVPFRHSKLTEVLMDYFVGEGRVVMIVNVNPYDTGYDENSHVMKFSAVAREVATTAPTAVARAVSNIPKGKPSLNPARQSDVVPHRRKVTISTGGPGQPVNETHLEVLEEDEDPGQDGEDEDDEPINPLVDALFDEIESLRMQLFESEMRSVVIEAQTREEVMTEMDDRMKKMEAMFTRRLMQEVEQYEMKMDAKIEMMQRSGMLNKAPVQPVRGMRESLAESEDSEETSEQEDDSEIHEESDDEDDDFDGSYSSAPVAARDHKLGARSSTSGETHDSDIGSEDTTTEPTNGSEASDSDEIQALPTPPNSQRSQAAPPPTIAKPNLRTTNAVGNRRSTRTTRNSSLSAVVEKTRALALDEDDDDVVAVIPNKARKSTGLEDSYTPLVEPEAGKKKKRQLSKKPVVTEEDIERTIGAEASQGASRQVRRSTRGKV